MQHVIDGVTYKEQPHDAFDYKPSPYVGLKPMTRKVSKSRGIRRYTKEEKNSMVEKYFDGVSVKAIAEYHKTNETTVRNCIARSKES